MPGLKRPLLVFGYGNPSRGDDALGSMLLERLEALHPPNADLLTDFQLQVEHALDLHDRERILFVDASVSCTAPYAFSRLYARKDPSYTTHVMSPMAVLHTYRELYGDPPSAYLLEVRGNRFELGESLSPEASVNLEAAYDLLRILCERPGTLDWEEFATARVTGPDE
ncbi:MAG TPA: hydrogenase maturation protease [Nitrosospira sp.]